MFAVNKLSKRYIQKSAGDDFNIVVRNEVTSTNTIMKDIAGKKAFHFDVLIASCQTAGRGRMGRNFHSPDGTGIYMSILLEIQNGENPLLITTDAAVCCARVIEKMSGHRTEIKWVNDIYMHGKKVCGILTEGVGKYAVLGIGVNVLPPKNGFPDDIKDRAGTVFEKKSAFIRETLAVEILREFRRIYTSSDRENLLQEYKERSMLTGREIQILKENENENATVLGIGDDYSLIVKKTDGKIANISSGDVIMVRYNKSH